MMDLQRDPNFKSNNVRLLAQTWKSGPGAAKPRDFSPVSNSFLVWRVEGKAVSGCRGEGSVSRSFARIVFKKRVGAKVCRRQAVKPYRLNGRGKLQRLCGAKNGIGENKLTPGPCSQSVI